MKSTKEIIQRLRDWLYSHDRLYYLYSFIRKFKDKQYFLETKESVPNTNIEDFKVFTDIAKLGVECENAETYVYVWALIESYYVQDGRLVSNSGSSMPYKFIIKNDEIIDYKFPRDGSEYPKSLKEIFPNNIRKKLDHSLVDNDNIKKQVEEHYSYL